MTKLLLISNGHGEDLSGSILGNELKKQGHEVAAFPLVGKGNAYTKSDIKTHGMRKEFSTGGLGYTSLIGRLTELVQGQLFYLIWTFLRLLQIARSYDFLIVVGDVVPILAAWLSHRKMVVYLVAYSSHYEGKLRLPWPAASCLKSKRCLEIFTRDDLTAKDLTLQLKRSVLFLGNPFMDIVLKPKKPLPQRLFRLGLLPGSRRPELDQNLLIILRVLQSLPQSILTNSEFSFDMALVNALNDRALWKLISKDGWQIIANSEANSFSHILNHGFCSVKVHRNSFAQVLQSSDVLLCMAGTAVEQAVGLGKPVIQIPGKGPQFTSAFAEAQRRLLGKTVFCAEGNVVKGSNIFLSTADLIVDIFNRVHRDIELKENCRKEASMRLGTDGGTQRIAESIKNLIFYNV
ncbi:MULTISPECIES: lipid-A-disaccharide synthase-related protein [unclassified Prochlorococcus]|uniref:lipid-A-disaccharide synthase-related protein n=1 Tax=unclassified Prochlorococcus TaxID=2627481 RepID=UPI0005337E63|nr:MULTISPECIES: lipid-A-disaccharide synthase-related protein [unclassified Prochlorococcus]KGG16818.1 hypothetical protein EV06_0661 [Prochlorococcus sp. MIT 0602]KGG18208.1 hypothetical protein EV07_0123 [Prochlorococcus sp. MIT 0603]